MVHRLERLGIWLGATVGGLTFLFVPVTPQPDMPAILPGVLYVLGVALLAVGVLGFASEVVGAVHRRLPGAGATTVAVPEPLPEPASLPMSSARLPARVTLDDIWDIFHERALVIGATGHQAWKSRSEEEAANLAATHVGTWMTVSGAFGQVTPTSGAELTFMDGPYSPGGSRIVLYMSFGKEWVESLASISQGTHVRVRGRIQSAGPEGIHLDSCELVGHGV